ncbi:hypothetical protein FPOAC2_06576 [Fusarium poae]
MPNIVYATVFEPDAKAYLSIAGRREDDDDIIDVHPSDIACHGKETLRINLMPGVYRQLSLDWRAPLTLYTTDMSLEAWGYPFHSACWKMLTAFRPITQQDLQTLLKLGRAMPKQKGMVNWGHDYGGRARQRHAVAPGEESILLAPVFIANYNIDPGDIKVFHHIFENHGQVSSQYNDRPAIKLRQVTLSDTFAKFPNEILFLIVEHLTLDDVTLLKQASRTIANLELPAGFWRNMFQAGQTFDYIIEAQQYSQVAWRSVCRAIKTVINSGASHHYAIWLRKHSWGMSRLLHQSLEAMHDQSACLGDNPLSLGESNAPRNSDDWVTVRCVQRFPCDTVDQGSILIQIRVLSLPTPIHEIYVSTVELFGRRYICGLKVVDESNNGYSIGFQHYQSIEIVTGIQGITGFDVAIDQRGIRGLSIVDKNASKSQWIGDHEDIPKQKLRSGLFGDLVTDLKCGFDGVKLVMLSVNEATSTHLNNLEIDELRHPILWYPRVPNPDLTFHAIEDHLVIDPIGELELPICFATFAEENPEKLSRIVVRHRALGRNVWDVESIAMESSSVQETSELGLGRTDHRYNHREAMAYDHEEAFEIDGQGGELINYTTTWWLNGMMVGLTLMTNRGRAYDFLGSIDKYQPPDGLRFSTKEPGNRTIVGFWADLTRFTGFHCLGLVLR